MAKISALILAKNEERNIEDCIRTVLFCDEVLVVDDFSTDRTKEMAERLGARVLQRRMDGDWGEYLPALRSDKITDSGVRLAKHKHSGVESGGSNTGNPV